MALVERELIGGECSFYACMPSKALLRPAQALAEARRVAGAAQAATGELDVAAALARRDEIIHGLDDSAQLPWLRGAAASRSCAGTGRSPASGGCASASACCRRAGRSCSRRAPAPRCRRSTGCARRALGPTARRPRPRRSPLAARARRRGRGGRAGAGLRLARRAGDDRRGARPADRARGGVRLRAGREALQDAGVEVRARRSRRTAVRA